MHYLFYILGVTLLVVPAGLLGRSQLEIASLPEIADRPRKRLGWLHWINFIDLARAWGGLLLVRQAFIAIDPGASAQTVPLLCLALSALAGLGLQQIFHSAGDDDLVAPVAYAVGLTFAFMPLQVALLALPLGLATALGLRSLGTGFVLAATTTAILGFLLRLSPVVVATASLVLFAPALLAGMLQRRLVLTIRRGMLERAAPMRDFPVARSTR
jgi:hypothetical protein